MSISLRNIKAGDSFDAASSRIIKRGFTICAVTFIVDDFTAVVVVVAVKGFSFCLLETIGDCMLVVVFCGESKRLLIWSALSIPLTATATTTGGGGVNRFK